MKKIMILMMSMFGIVLLVGCESIDQSQKQAGLSIKTTVYPLTYLAETIGGDAVQVESILPAGADAHDYEPTQQDIITLGESNVFFYIGIGDQHTLVEELETVLGNETVQFVDTAINITPIYGDAHDHDHEGESEEEHEEHADELSADPHVWLDPLRMGQLAEQVYQTLTEQLPEKKAQLTKNYEQLMVKLESLDQKYMDELAKIENKHTLVTHNAYGYWEARYDLTLIALSDLTNSAELTQQEIITISEEIEHEGVRSIFTAPNIQSAYTQSFIKQFDLAAFELQNLETVSVADKPTNVDYFTMMEANLAQLVEGLSIQEPVDH